MSQKESPTKGKRSLMDMFQGSRTMKSPSKDKRISSSRTPPRKNGGDKIEFRDVMTPNTRQLVNSNGIKSNKIFNDSVHTHITLEPVCVRIADTPQYQRLVSSSSVEVMKGLPHLFIL